MKLHNNMNINVTESYYNKAIKGEDNVYTIDTDTRYPLYELSIYKSYKDMTKNECISQIITDLEYTLDQLKELDNQIQLQNDIESY